VSSFDPRAPAEEAFTRLFNGLGEEVGTCDEDPMTDEAKDGLRMLRRVLDRNSVSPGSRAMRVMGRARPANGYSFGRSPRSA
jgi:hypothetical protein